MAEVVIECAFCDEFATHTSKGDIEKERDAIAFHAAHLVGKHWDKLLAAKRITVGAPPTSYHHIHIGMDMPECFHETACEYCQRRKQRRNHVS